MSEVHPITFRLKVFNAWRRGNDAPQPDPKTVGEDIDSICDIAKRLELERDEAKRKHRAEHDLANEAIATWKKTKEERDALQEQLDAALMLSKMQERRHERELEQVREQYRLSSVCRELKEENEKLKRFVTWPHDVDPFTSPDHDNESRNYP